VKKTIKEIVESKMKFPITLYYDDKKYTLLKFAEGIPATVMIIQDGFTQPFTYDYVKYHERFTVESARQRRFEALLNAKVKL
jgi:hypothetical protein